jgi:hypothetical protein
MTLGERIIDQAMPESGYGGKPHVGVGWAGRISPADIVRNVGRFFFPKIIGKWSNDGASERLVVFECNKFFRMVC